MGFERAVPTMTEAFKELKCKVQAIQNATVDEVKSTV